MSMHMGHVALRVGDLERASSYVKLVLGIRETLRLDHEVRLTANEKSYELQLLEGDTPGFDHVGLEVESEAELEQVLDRAVGAGAELLGGSTEPGLGRAVRLTGPADIVYEVYAGMPRKSLTIDTHLNPRARRFGHLTFFSPQRAELVTFWVNALGFRVSDTTDDLTWLRCDSDHHGLAVGDHPEANLLHHHAWEVQDLGTLGQYCDHIARAGLSLFWGPVRHGPGFNLATYLPDSEGGVIEVYTDLLRIRDDQTYKPIDWSNKPRALNLWGPSPSPELLAAGVPVIPAEKTSPGS
jgi:catechol 2,3-dioxygenase